MKNLRACYSHITDEWRTPTELYNKIMQLGYIDTFPYNAPYNEFAKTYKNKKLFVNPPFSKLNLIPKWIKHQLANGNEILLLMPARTDTKYFHELLNEKPIIFFIKGRLHFNDSKSAPFPTIILYLTRKYINFPLYETIDKTFNLIETLDQDNYE